MAVEKIKRKVGRPKDKSKMPLYCRINREAVERLDAIAAEMRPQPSRAQLIDLAVQEFVERRSGSASQAS